MSYSIVPPPAPGESDFFTQAEHLGHALVLTSYSIVEMSTRQHGVMPAVATDVACISCLETWRSARLWGQVVTSQIGRVQPGGEPLAVTLVRGNAKPGKSSPWLLDAITDEQLVKLTQQFLDRFIGSGPEGPLMLHDAFKAARYAKQAQAGNESPGDDQAPPPAPPVEEPYGDEEPF